MKSQMRRVLWASPEVLRGLRERLNLQGPMASWEEGQRKAYKREYGLLYRNLNVDKKSKSDRSYFLKNKEKIYARIKKWKQKNHTEQRIYFRNYYSEHRSSFSKYSRKHYRAFGRKHHKKADRLKTNSRARFKHAIKIGVITRPDTCSKCGIKCKPDGHHPDYNKHLDVIWMCKVCHGKEHRLYKTY